MLTMLAPKASSPRTAPLWLSGGAISPSRMRPTIWECMVARL